MRACSPLSASPPSPRASLSTPSTRGDRFRRDVLAAGDARRGDHVLSFAADAARARPSPAGGCSGRERPVQSHAQPRRRDRARAHRHRALRPRAGPCRAADRTPQGGDAGAAAAIGLPPELVAAQAGAPDPTALDFIFPLIEKAAFVEAIDEAWAMMAMLVALGLLTVPLLGTRVHGGERAPAVGPRSSLHPSIITGPQTRAAGAGKPAASDSGTAGRNGCLPGAVSDRALDLA